MTVMPQPLTPAGFTGYGRVVLAPAGDPTSQAADYKFWSDLASYHVQGETEIGICTVFRRPARRIDTLERHLRTPEILIPIDGGFVVPLLREGDPATMIRAFRVQPGEAVVIDPGIWHGACLPQDRPECSYFVIFRRHTPREDVHKLTIAAVKIG